MLPGFFFGIPGAILVPVRRGGGGGGGGRHYNSSSDDDDDDQQADPRRLCPRCNSQLVVSSRRAECDECSRDIGGSRGGPHLMCPHTDVCDYDACMYSCEHTARRQQQHHPHDDEQRQLLHFLAQSVHQLEQIARDVQRDRRPAADPPPPPPSQAAINGHSISEDEALQIAMAESMHHQQPPRRPTTTAQRMQQLADAQQRLLGRGGDIDSMSYEELSHLCEAIGNAPAGGMTDRAIISKVDQQKPQAAAATPVVAGQDCSICLIALTDTSDNGPAVATTCAHHFHRDCLQQWLRQAPSCPVCRTSQQQSHKHLSYVSAAAHTQ